MTNADRLERNIARCARIARAMRRQIQQRLDYGDTLLVGDALETLARQCAYVNGAQLLEVLRRCDGVVFSQLLGFYMTDDRLMWRCTGKNRAAWLALIKEEA